MATSKKKGKKDKKQSLPEVEPIAEETDELKSDAFDDFMFHAANYIYVRRKLFITLAVVSIVALFSGYGTYRFLQHKDDVRNEKLYAIERILNDGSLKSEKRFEKALPELDSFIRENEGEKQYKIALFYRSGLYFERKKFNDAEADLNALLSITDKDSEMYAVASLYLANILRDQEKIERAVETLENAKIDSMADVILMELAEIHLEADRKDKAKQTLRILTQDYPQSIYAARAKQLLGTL